MGISVEQGFITELLLSRDMNTITDYEINGGYLSGSNREAFKYITQHFSKYGKVPSTIAFRRRFPDFEFAEVDGDIGTSEDINYWCDEVRTKKKHNLIAKSVEEATECINLLDTDKVHELLKKVVLKIENEVIKSDKTTINSNTQKRKEAYLKRKKSGGITGLTTGIPEYDIITGGQNNGELTGIMGFTGIGKSWMILIQAVNQAKMGIKVLFGTTEMSTEMIMRRIDALWCGLNYERFVRGQLKKDEEKRYFKYLEEIEGKEDTCLIVEHIDDAIQFSAKIDQHKPETAYLDGAYILQDSDADNDWQSFRNVVRILHQTCLSKKLPITFTTQAKEETGNSLKTINFAKSIAQEVDCFIALEQDEEMRLAKELRIKFLKQREGKIGTSLYLNWDFDKMNYSTIYKSKEEIEVEENKGVIKID